MTHYRATVERKQNNDLTIKVGFPSNGDLIRSDWEDNYEERTLGIAEGIDPQFNPRFEPTFEACETNTTTPFFDRANDDDRHQLLRQVTDAVERTSLAKRLSLRDYVLTGYIRDKPPLVEFSVYCLMCGLLHKTTSCLAAASLRGCLSCQATNCFSPLICRISVGNIKYFIWFDSEALETCCAHALDSQRGKIPDPWLEYLTKTLTPNYS